MAVLAWAGERAIKAAVFKPLRPLDDAVDAVAVVAVRGLAQASCVVAEGLQVAHATSPVIAI